jgi:hypothetical protein
MLEYIFKLFSHLIQNTAREYNTTRKKRINCNMAARARWLSMF